MTVEPWAGVVDASVCIKLFVDEPLSERAHALFTHLVAVPPAHLYVPDLLFVECANILWKYVRRSGYPAADARQALVDLSSLAVRSVSSSDLIVGAIEISIAYSISAYDACYVELARRLKLPLVTADEALVRRLAGSLYDVQSLSTFVIPA